MLCKTCVYEPKCSDPHKGTGCADFKDKFTFLEIPFMVNQIVYYIEPATKYVPVTIDGDAYFKLVDNSKVVSHMFDCGELEDYLPPMIPGCVRERRKYYATKQEAEAALEEVRNSGGAKNVCKDDH